MEELGVAQSAYDEILERGGEVVVITADSTEEVKTTVDKHGFTFHWLADPEFKAVDAFKLRHPEAMPGMDAARPAIFFVRADGTPAAERQPDSYRFVITKEALMEGFDKAVGEKVES